MKLNSDHSRQLADYIYSDLGPEDAAYMESEIANDPELSESYRMNRRVTDYLKVRLQLESMRNDPRLEDAESLAQLAFATESDRPRKNRRYFAYASGLAAAVAILVTVGSMALNTTTSKLFDRYYRPLDASDYTRRGSENFAYQDITEAIESYTAGQYEQSIRRFSDLEKAPDLLAEVQFFTGISHMGLHDFTEAKLILQDVVDEGSRYQLEAMWYLSLCYLKTGEVHRAIDLLSQLGTHQGFYRADAQALVKKLRRIRP